MSLIYIILNMTVTWWNTTLHSDATAWTVIQFGCVGWVCLGATASPSGTKYIPWKLPMFSMYSRFHSCGCYTPWFTYNLKGMIIKMATLSQKCCDNVELMFEILNMPNPNKTFLYIFKLKFLNRFFLKNFLI